MTGQEPEENKKPIIPEWTGGDTPERRLEDLQKLAAQLQDAAANLSQETADLMRSVGLDPDKIPTPEEAAAFLGKAAMRTGKELGDAAPLPFILLGINLASGGLAAPAAVMIIAGYSNMMRNVAEIKDERPGVGLLEGVGRGVWRIPERFAGELFEALDKSYREIRSADANGDGKVSLREGFDAFLDVAGNFMPGYKLGNPKYRNQSGGMMGPVIDAALAAPSYIGIGAAQAGVNDALGVTDTVARGIVGAGVATTIVPGLAYVGRNDEKWLGGLFATKAGRWVYDNLGFDGKFGPGGDQDFDGDYDKLGYPVWMTQGPNGDGPTAGPGGPGLPPKRGPRTPGSHDALTASRGHAAMPPEPGIGDAANDTDQLSASDVVVEPKDGQAPAGGLTAAQQKQLEQQRRRRAGLAT